MVSTMVVITKAPKVQSYPDLPGFDWRDTSPIRAMHRFPGDKDKKNPPPAVDFTGTKLEDADPEIKAQQSIFQRNRALRARMVFGEDVVVPELSPKQRSDRYAPQSLQGAAKLLGLGSQYQPPKVDWTKDADVLDIIHKGHDAHDWYDRWREYLDALPVESRNAAGKPHDSETKRRAFGTLGQGTEVGDNFALVGKALSREHHGLLPHDKDEYERDIDLGITKGMSAGTKTITHQNVIDSLTGIDVRSPKIADYTSGFFSPEERRRLRMQSGAAGDEWMLRSLHGVNGAPTEEQYQYLQGRIRHLSDNLGIGMEAAQAAFWVGYKRHLKEHFEGLSEQLNGLPRQANGDEQPAVRAAQQGLAKHTAEATKPGLPSDIAQRFNMSDPQGGTVPLPLFRTHEIMARNADKLRNILSQDPYIIVGTNRWELKKGADRIFDHLNEQADPNDPSKGANFDQYQANAPHPDTQLSWHYRHANGQIKDFPQTEGQTPTHLAGAKQTIQEMVRRMGDAKIEDNNNKNPDAATVLKEGFSYNSQSYENPRAIHLIHHAVNTDADFRNDMATLHGITERADAEQRAKVKNPWAAAAQDHGPSVAAIAEHAMAHVREHAPSTHIDTGYFAQGSYHDANDNRNAAAEALAAAAALKPGKRSGGGKVPGGAPTLGRDGAGDQGGGVSLKGLRPGDQGAVQYAALARDRHRGGAGPQVVLLHTGGQSGERRTAREDDRGRLVHITIKGTDLADLRGSDTPKAKFRPTSGALWVNDAGLAHIKEHFNLGQSTAAIALGSRSAQQYLAAAKRRAERDPEFHDDMVRPLQEALAHNPSGLSVQRMRSFAQDMPFARHEAVHMAQMAQPRRGPQQNSMYGLLSSAAIENLKQVPSWQKATNAIEALGYNKSQAEVEIPAHIAAGQHATHLDLSDQEAQDALKHYCSAIVAQHGDGAARRMFQRSVGLARRVAFQTDPVEGIQPDAPASSGVQKSLSTLVIHGIQKAYLLRRPDQYTHYDYVQHPTATSVSENPNRQAGAFDVPQIDRADQMAVRRRQHQQDAAFQPVHTHMDDMGFSRAGDPFYTRGNPIIHQNVMGDAGDPQRVTHHYTGDAFRRGDWQALRQHLTESGLQGVQLMPNGNGATVTGYHPGTNVQHTIHIAPTPISALPNARQVRTNAASAQSQRFNAVNRAAQSVASHAAALKASEQEQKRLKQTHEVAGEFTNPEKAQEVAGDSGHVFQPDVNTPVYHAYTPKKVGRVLPRSVKITGVPQKPVASVPPVPPLPASPVDQDQVDDEMPEEAAKMDARQQRRANRRAAMNPTSADVPLRTPSTTQQIGASVASQLSGTRVAQPQTADENDPFA